MMGCDGRAKPSLANCWSSKQSVAGEMNPSDCLGSPGVRRRLSTRTRESTHDPRCNPVAPCRNVLQFHFRPDPPSNRYMEVHVIVEAPVPLRLTCLLWSALLTQNPP